MSNCIRCGSGFLMRKRIQLKDADICGKCFKELGFDKHDAIVSKLKTWDEIKDGHEAYVARLINRKAAEYDAEHSTVSLANYGQERDLICTQEEREIFDRIVDEFPEDGLRLVRVSDNYVSVKRGDWDIVRLKFTNRAKWLMFPSIESGTNKFPIDEPREIEDFFASVLESIETAKKYDD